MSSLEVAAVRAHLVRETKPQVCLTDMPPAPREMKGQHTQQLSYPELDGKRQPGDEPHAAYAEPGRPIAGMYKRAQPYKLSRRIGHGAEH